MENQKQYKSIAELINDLKSVTDKMEHGSLSFTEMEDVLNTSRELHERLVILKYKAVEKFVKGDEYDDGKNRFKLNLKRTNQLSLEEVISDTVKEKLEKAQTNFLEDLTPEAPKVEAPAVVEEPQKEDPIKQEPVTAQKPVNAHSVNDKFSSQTKKTVADKLNKSPIKDLKTAVGINMKFLFMNDLFKGDNVSYNEALEKLNTFSNIDEAKSYLEPIKNKMGWDDEHSSVLAFLDLVERRYL